jgi:hypothetical protein
MLRLPKMEGMATDKDIFARNHEEEAQKILD